KYKFKDINYADLTTENRHENDARLSVVFADKGEHLQLTMRGRYLDTVDQSTSEFFSNFGARAKRNDLAWTGELAWAISKRLKAAATGGFRFNKYLNAAFIQETNEQIDLGGNVFYQITPLTAFGFKYNYREILYTSAATFNVDSHTHSISAVVRWQPSAIISGDFGVGYDNKSFDSPGVSSQDTFNYHTHLKYSLTSRTIFHLSGKRSVEESTFSVINAYIRTFVELEWKQRWTSKIKSSVSARYLNRNYDTAVADIIDDGGKLKNRNDDEFSLGVRGDYQFNRFYKASMSYEYKYNESNFNVFDYESNVFTISLSAGF
ncbi:MAG: outer membrane beta-barrel protein, partial [Nitrospinales bacterium]